VVRVSGARAIDRPAGGRERERGATIVIAGLVMTALLGFAALVIDIANATQVRRQAQNTADAAALAGAQDLPDGAAVVATVKDYAERNLDIAPEDWAGCSDLEALSQHPDGVNTNTCISIDAAFERVRVSLPERDVATYFGGVFGVEKLSVSASAIAEAQLRGDGRIIPAAVTASMGTGNLCIENSGNNQGCASRSSGNFGSLDSPRLNIYQPSSNEDPNNLRTNYAMSLDHDVRIFGGAQRICDGDTRTPCSVSNQTTGSTANHLNVYTGNAVPPVTEGWVTGFTINTDDSGKVSFCGRLQRPDITESNVADPHPNNCTPSAGPTINVLGKTINGRHISYWMQTWARQIFYPEIGTSNPAVGDAQFVNGDAKLSCFLAGYRYNQTTGVETAPTNCGVSLPGGRTNWFPMFDLDLPNDPRFGVIPVVQYWPSGGSEAIPLVGFWAEFTYRLYPGPSKLDAVDAWVFDPALIATESGTPGLQFGFQTDPVVRLVG
jgi:hypothetical protein